MTGQLVYLASEPSGTGGRLTVTVGTLGPVLAGDLRELIVQASLNPDGELLSFVYQPLPADDDDPLPPARIGSLRLVDRGELDE